MLISKESIFHCTCDECDAEYKTTYLSCTTICDDCRNRQTNELRGN